MSSGNSLRIVRFRDHGPHVRARRGAPLWVDGGRHPPPHGPAGSGKPRCRARSVRSAPSRATERTSGSGPSDRVFRIRASDGKLLEEWSIRKAAGALVVAMGRVFVAGFGLHGEPGILSMIDPRRSPGEAAVVATELPTYPFSPAFDGERFWTANSAGSVSTDLPFGRDRLGRSRRSRAASRCPPESCSMAGACGFRMPATAPWSRSILAAPCARS